MKKPIKYNADKGEHFDRDQTYVIRKQLETLVKDNFGLKQAELDELFHNCSNEGIMLTIETTPELTKDSFVTTFKELKEGEEIYLNSIAMATCMTSGAANYDIKQTNKWN